MRAYHAYRASGDDRGAARMALWLAEDHADLRGEPAVAEGWFSRAARLVADLAPCPEQGWLTAFEAHAALGRGDLATALRRAADAAESGRRHGRVDLEMFAVATEGAARLGEGELDEGMRRLSEAATAALAGEYENLVPASWSCCLLIAACEDLRDHDRSAQWCEQIAAFSERTDARFLRGVCRAHYGAVLAWRGRLHDAEGVLLAAADSLTERRPTWQPEALARLGELRRLQGRDAEAADVAAGRVAAGSGAYEHACDRFEDAIDVHRRCGAPLEAAVVHVELAESLDALGRSEAAIREARTALEALEGVLPRERARAEAVLAHDDGRGPPANLLTPRQVEVLRLIAEGMSDQEVAERLVLSEHTVHRHVANIYFRLGCSTRAATVARASRLGLL